MRSIFWFIFLPVLVFGADFITKSEHAAMLYQNPRGIGCDKCHGKHGEGLLLSTYKNFNKKTKEQTQEEVRTPPINALEFEHFSNAVKNPKGFMPSYFLTDDEIILIYEYVKNLKPEPKKGKKK